MRLTRRGLLGAGAAGAMAAFLPDVASASSVLSSAFAATAVAHPRIYTDAAGRDALIAKLSTAEWAKASLAALKASIDPLADRHQTDPAWILSRMSMFWTEGQRFTQIYVAKQNFARGEGNAPVPTLRMDATRVWNSNKNAPLAQRLPYSADGSMINTEGQTIPYLTTGHMVRLNNEELLSIAQQAAFLHWVTADDKYAKLGADIYWQWLLGVYYMKPMLDPTKSLGGPGGYAPGGIGGYYDYEVIHDVMGGMAAPVYDLLYDYLHAHPDPHAVAIGRTVAELSTEVFKRFIEIGLVRGGFSGNWNVNGWSSILPAILALEPNDQYADGKGREFYLNGYTTASTVYHQCLPDLLREYDQITGLWHESPMYSFGTISTLVDFALPIERAGVDTIGGNATMQKAALAITPWLDARGNTVVFGDGRGGSPGYLAFERLLTYYLGHGDTPRATQMAEVLRNAVAAGQYNRTTTSWTNLIFNVDLDTVPVSTSQSAGVRTAYSAHHRHITMKNRNDVASGLMATLYGGHGSTDHLNPNGLALQLYGQGWALAPNAKAYESYWTADYKYHSGPAGANTIVPGYSYGPVTVNAMEPAVPADAFTNKTEISAEVQFADVSAAEKRRQVTVVRTSETTGYYVDVFRSDQADNDYLHHNLGNTLAVSDGAGAPLSLSPATDLGTANNPAYSYFGNVRSVGHSGDLRARWAIDASATTPEIGMDLWMSGQTGRTLYAVDAPATTLGDTVTPNGVNKLPQTTPTLIVRQTGNNAASAPFVAVFEPTLGGDRRLQSITTLASTPTFVGLKIESTRRTDYLLSSPDGGTQVLQPGLEFTGTHAVVAEARTGVDFLYLGHGTDLRFGRHRLTAVADAPIAAGLSRAGTDWQYSADAAVTVTLPLHGHARKAKIQYRTSTGYVTAASVIDPRHQTISAELPAGYGVSLRIADR
ncbi:hypothetical protein ABZS29_17790 [Kribbella sp. NPDC005582]|uniref:hypothetical protein n=1 Tax=Kribbella sp. NPDC005582 TaxID=3156893 RepID=UPI0033A89311